MIKILHYIKEDYSGDIEKYCYSTLRRDYPDFEFMAWKPGSSPLRVLYDHGGLFIGPHFLSMKRIDNFYLEKSFIAFNNSINTDFPNFNNCCYASQANQQIYMDFMKKGVEKTLAEKGYTGSFEAKTALKGSDVFLDEINLLNRVDFGGFDKLSLDVWRDSYVMDSNMDMNEKLDGWNLHYVVFDGKTDSNKVHALCENFFSHKYEDGSKHYMLFACNDLERDLGSRIGDLINYKNVSEKKKAGMIVVGNGIEEGEVGKLLIEYIGRKFTDLRSCERLL